MRNFIAATLACTLLLSNPVLAEDEWKYRLSPYIWFAGMEGDVGPLKGAPPAEINISPSEALDDTETSFMMTLDAKKGKHGVYADIVYSDIDMTDTINAFTSTKLKTNVETTMLTVGYSHIIFNDSGKNIDLLAGVRWWSIDADIEISSNIPILNVGDDNAESWFDPFIGMKGNFPIADSKFYLSGGFGYGGFGINADSFYDISANVGYQWSASLASVIGYRLFELDYDQNDFQYDVEQAGWQVGLTWNL